MSQTAAGTAVHDRPHPTPRDYWRIAVILGAITAIEIAASYVEGIRGVIVAVLVVSAVLKFAIVAGWYMHLRFDLPQFTRFFLIGIIGALILFAVVLLTFGLLIGN